METFTFNYKTKVEQFKEQFPELYQEIYNLGYSNGYGAKYYSDDLPIDYHEDYPDYDKDNDPSYYQPEYAKPEDDSERYCIIAHHSVIYGKAEELENQGYKAGNRDWREFMNSYKDWEYRMYIAWNPTHKQFAVESDGSVIDERYPHLVGAIDYINGPDELPF